MPPFSVIIPAFNEEEGVVSVIRAIRAAGLSCEVVVVDDGSTDGTAAAARGAGATVLRHPANAGYGMSLMDGIGAATSDIIVIIDADGSYPVETIPALVDKIEQGFDMAVGARLGTQQYDSLLRIPARWVFRFLVEFTIGARVPDINSGLRSFRKSQALPYFPDLCRGFSFTTTLTLIYILSGKYIVYLPIEYRRRIGRSKVRIIRDTLRTLQYIIEVIATYNPLKLFLLLSLLPGALAIGTMAWWAVARQPTLLIVASILLGTSFILFGLGPLAFLGRKQVPADPSAGRPDRTGPSASEVTPATP
jgi:polyisoprenyl-phosphate glycosyltransferase